MNLTNKQWLGIIAAVLSGLVAGTAQLTDVFGAEVAKAVVSMASLASMMLNSIIVGISGQGSIVRDVAAMPGVEKITVNAAANTTLATIAAGPEAKVEAAPGAENAVASTANNAG